MNTAVRAWAHNGVFSVSSALRLDALWRTRAVRRMLATETHLIQVVNFHHTPPEDRDSLRKQMSWVSRHFRIIDFDAFTRFWSDAGRTPAAERVAVLFTFDDGLKSQYEVAAPVLEEFGARALFFVIPRFCEARGPDARRFFRERVSPMARLTNPDAEFPMSLADVADLSRRGHTIGSHTMSHARLSAVPPYRLREEIVGSRSLLETWIGRPVDAFAWTFSCESITPAAWRLAAETYRFCFSPCPGVNDLRQSPALLWRTNIEAAFPPQRYRCMYSGLAELPWARQRRLLHGMLRGS